LSKWSPFSRSRCALVKSMSRTLRLPGDDSAPISVTSAYWLARPFGRSTMKTTRPVVARLENGRTRPSMRTLERLAEATGSRASCIACMPWYSSRLAGRSRVGPL
jgi:hypothetical protein